MPRHIFLGVAAWLAGASAATGGSLLAVSVLGQGMTPSGGDQQSVTTVNRALAREAADRAAAIPRRSASSAAPATGPRSEADRRSKPSATRAGRHPAPPPSPGAAAGTVLTSEGGTLVASCAGARAYLVSWSPQQGFGSGDVARGPATDARVMFISGQVTVTMVVSCDAGVPTASSTAVSTVGSAASSSAGDGE